MEPEPWKQQLRDYAAELREQAARSRGRHYESALFLATFVESFCQFSDADAAERTLAEWFASDRHPAFARVSEILNAARQRRVLWRWQR